MSEPSMFFSDTRAHTTSRNSTEVIVAFSHLRWDGVFQRPQQLLSRLAMTRKVFVWEEPVLDETLGSAFLQQRLCSKSGVTVLTPVIATWERHERVEKDLLDAWLASNKAPIIRWYYTPMMLPFSAHIDAVCTVYDCMDELSGFLNAPPELLLRETALFKAADVVFTGGASLYASKSKRHDAVYLFPSSIDAPHFHSARMLRESSSGAPILGYCGVIDERLDLSLIAQLADQMPDATIEMAGPVVKINEAELPRRPNIRWLGRVDYDDLPGLMANWTVALMPFAMNEATRFISPTKTPEYLAAGLPVVSTPVPDVVSGYGTCPGVCIADASGFVGACGSALQLAKDPSAWLGDVDTLLAAGSWNDTATRMSAIMSSHIAARTKRLRTARKEHYDVLVVGAGFAGSVMAERLANDSGKRVLVVDRRPHIGGNAFDHLDEAGILIHQYGPHIFHTNSDAIVDYLSAFTEWRPYEHRVLASVDGMLVPMPINRTTLNALFGLSLNSDQDAAVFLASRAEPVAVVRTSADVVISAVGQELYEKFFRGYTRKQWGLDPSELDKAVTSRVPTRTNTDDRYFTDSFQAMPLHGYTKMFERMLANPLIEVRTGVEFGEVRQTIDFDHLVFTGPVDEFFGHRYGKLPYRSLRFEHRTIDQSKFQDVSVVNYPDESVPYTRITEYKYLTGQESDKTSITYEYPQAEGDPYYPIPRPENEALFKRYEALADAQDDVTFVGRLATYRYYNMDQVVGQALATYRKLVPLLVRTGSLEHAREDTAVAVA